MTKPLYPGIIINTAANNGTALKKWKRIKSMVLNRFPNHHILEYVPPLTYQDLLMDWIHNKKINSIFYAGGDGTMNYLLNSIMAMDYELWKDLYFGGLGLGSSNDFQKPYRHFIQKVPTRLELNDAPWSDIGWVTFVDLKGQHQKKYFLINASLGVTAAANLLFNRGDAFINRMKPLVNDLAIIYAAIKTILIFKNLPLSLSWNGQQIRVNLSNLAVLKMPAISGSFKFPQPIRQDDGRLGINICQDMSKIDLLKTLYQLSRGQFENDAKRRSFFTNALSIEVNEPVPLETDGEVYQAQKIEFGILHHKIKLLS